jgi:leucyl aminopeptidase
MKIKVVTASKLDTHIIFITKEDAQTVKDFKAESGTSALRYEGAATLIYCGLGETAKISAQTLRSAAAVGIQRAAEIKRARVAMLEPVLSDQVDGGAMAVVEGALLGSYAFDTYKSEKTFRVTSCEFVSESLTPREVTAIAALCDCVAYARDLVNENAGEVHPLRLAQEARALAASKTMRCTVIDEKGIAKLGLGLLKAVGQGAPYPPRLIIMEYRGALRSTRTVAVVGKGVTFDSGGQNLKPTGSIETMRCDMAGAATVLGLMKAAAALKLDANILGVIPAAYNAVDGTAYFPGDIYRSFAGTTVEITSTDAEGRLILADAIAYVQKKYRPTELIDFATLTGAVITALGTTMAGLFANDDDLAQKLFDAGEATGERVWRLPVRDEHRESMKGDLADLRNTSKWKKGCAGSITGAAFIQEFIKDIPWAHLDIAGTAFNEGEARGETPKFGTGFGVRLMVEYLRDTAGKLPSRRVDKEEDSIPF